MTGCTPPSFHFCPCCAGGLERREDNGQPRLVCRECGKILYLNPAVGVAAHPQEPGGITLPLSSYPFLVVNFYRKVNKQQ